METSKTWKAIGALAAVIMVALSLKVAFAVTVTSNISINQSQISNTDIYLNVTLAPNSTLFVQRVDTESRLNITYPNETVFGNLSKKEVVFNVSIKDNVTENTTLVSLFNLSSDLNNNTFLYSIVADIQYIPKKQPEPIEETKEFFMTVLNGNWFINITTNILPRSGTAKYEIAGIYNEKLEVVCPKGWLECPKKTIRFNINELARFDIEYLVPLSAKLGAKTYQVNLTTGNISMTTNITFMIKEPDITFASYQFRDDCFVPIEGEDMFAVKMECMKEKEEFDAKRLTRLWERMNALRNESVACECEPEIVIEYVMAGDIEKNILDDYENCRNDRKELNKKLNTCHGDVSKTQGERNKCLTALNNNESAYLASKFDTSVEKFNKAKEADRNATRKIWLFSGVIILLSVSGFGIFKLYRSNKKEAWHKF